MATANLSLMGMLQAASITARTALGTPTAGCLVYRTDLTTYEEYTGARWNLVGTAHCTTLAAIQAIDSMVEGSMAYCGDKIMYRYVNSKWRWGQTFVTYAQADVVLTSTTTYAPSGMSTPTMTASSTYAFDITVGVVAVTAVGLKIALNYTLNATVNCSTEGNAASTNAYWNSWLQAQSMSSGAPNLSLGTYGGGSNGAACTFHTCGTLVTSGTPSALSIFCTQGVSSATTVYLLAGSTMRVWQLA